MPAPTYVLARAAWIPTLVIWHADGRFTRLDGAAMRGVLGGIGRELAAAAGARGPPTETLDRHAAVGPATRSIGARREQPGRDRLDEESRAVLARVSPAVARSPILQRDSVALRAARVFVVPRSIGRQGGMPRERLHHGELLCGRGDRLRGAGVASDRSGRPAVRWPEAPFRGPQPEFRRAPPAAIQGPDAPAVGKEPAHGQHVGAGTLRAEALSQCRDRRRVGWGGGRAHASL